MTGREVDQRARWAIVRVQRSGSRRGHQVRVGDYYSWRRFKATAVTGLLLLAATACSNTPQAAPTQAPKADIVMATGTKGCSGKATFHVAQGWKLDGDHLVNGDAVLYATCMSPAWLTENSTADPFDLTAQLQSGDSRCQESGAMFKATVAGGQDGAVCDLGAADGHHWLHAQVVTADGNVLDLQVDLRKGDAAFRANAMDLIASVKYAPA